MNQGGALVHIYMDGTVLVTTGGIEMGQGLHTKCCMVRMLRPAAKQFAYWSVDSCLSCLTPSCKLCIMSCNNIGAIRCTCHSKQCHRLLPSWPGEGGHLAYERAFSSSGKSVPYHTVTFRRTITGAFASTLVVLSSFRVCHAMPTSSQAEPV